MPVITGARTFQGSRHVVKTVCFQKSSRILLPIHFVKIYSKKPAGLNQQPRPTTSELPPGVLCSASLQPAFCIKFNKTQVRALHPNTAPFLINNPMLITFRIPQPELFLCFLAVSFRLPDRVFEEMGLMPASALVRRRHNQLRFGPLANLQAMVRQTGLLETPHQR